MTQQPTVRACWCGNNAFAPFNADYGHCGACGTLVALRGLTAQQVEVNDDNSDFYGKQYWLDHQQRDLGFPDIHARARSDLTERNLHWLRTLLGYRLPPAKVLELGCSPGSFVALLNLAGYAASGVELSPWVVEFGRRTFGVPIAVGPVEGLDIAPGSLDVIAMMDVLEHLSDPLATLAHCLKLLKPDGLFLIQTPQFKDRVDHAALLETNDPFLEMLKADEHLYLFSQDSVGQLLSRIGVRHVRFEPAIFGRYDMFFAASPTPLAAPAGGAVDECLLSTPHGRAALALLDLRERETRLIDRVRESDADRTARAGQNETLRQLLEESEADRAARAEQIETLATLLEVAETDRTARAGQIETLGRLLEVAETDRAARGEQIETLGRLLETAEADRAARAEQIEALGRLLDRSEANRCEMRSALAGLFAQPSFRLASKVVGWREVAQLRGWATNDDAS